MDKITRSGRTLVFDKRVHPAVRLAIFLAGLFPLLAPYELLTRVRWEQPLALPFLISFAFSLFGIAFSVFIVFIALFAQNQHVCIDGGRSILVHGWSDAVRAYREAEYRFEELSAPGLKTHTWSDGPDSYDILVGTGTGTKISFGDFESKDEAQRYVTEVGEMLARS